MTQTGSLLEALTPRDYVAIAVGLVGAVLLAPMILAHTGQSPSEVAVVDGSGEAVYQPMALGSGPPAVDTPVRRAHPIRAAHGASLTAIERYLTQNGSPLADHARQILASRYWSTIIAICTIEEDRCSINPYGTNNFWGLMVDGRLLSYGSVDAGIQAIDDFLARAEAGGRTTLESFNGWYCQSECNGWYPTVVQTKLRLETMTVVN